MLQVLTSSALSNTSGAADLVASTAASTSLDGLLDDAAEYGWRDESRPVQIHLETRFLTQIFLSLE